MLNEKQEIMKTIDLSDLKIGDTAWSCEEGEVLIQKSLEGINLHYPITTESHSYTIEGKHYKGDLHPALFRSKQEFLEYWGLEPKIESNTLTKREQFAMAAMQGILANNRAPEFDYKHVTSAAIRFADYLSYNLAEIDPEIL